VRPVAAVEERACSDNSCSVSNDKARVCGLWDACPIVVVAQRPVDWRPANSTRCVSGGPSPHSLLQNLHLYVVAVAALTVTEIDVLPITVVALLASRSPPLSSVTNDNE